MQKKNLKNINETKELKASLKPVEVGAPKTEVEPVMVDPYDVEIRSLTGVVEDRLPASIVKVIQRIVYEISVVGLSEDEACLMANYPLEKLTKLKKDEPSVARLIEMKMLAYERGILKNLSMKARTDDKLGQWMLERRQPEKYNVKKGSGKSGGGDDEGLLAAAIQFVQTSGDSEPIVKTTSGKAIIIKKGSNTVDVDLEKFLA